MVLSQTGQNPWWPGTTTVWEGVRDEHGVVHPTSGSNSNAGDDEKPSDQARPGFHAVAQTELGIIGLYAGPSTTRITLAGVKAVTGVARGGVVAFFIPSRPGAATGATVVAQEPGGQKLAQAAAPPS